MSYLLYEDELRLAQLSPEPVGVGAEAQTLFSEKRGLAVRRRLRPTVPAGVARGFLLEQRNPDNPEWRTYRDLATFRAVSPNQFAWNRLGEGTARLVTLQELGTKSQSQARSDAFLPFVKSDEWVQLLGLIKSVEDWLDLTRKGGGALPGNQNRLQGLYGLGAADALTTVSSVAAIATPVAAPIPGLNIAVPAISVVTGAFSKIFGGGDSAAEHAAKGQVDAKRKAEELQSAVNAFVKQINRLGVPMRNYSATMLDSMEKATYEQMKGTFMRVIFDAWGRSRGALDVYIRPKNRNSMQWYRVNAVLWAMQRQTAMLKSIPSSKAATAAQVYAPTARVTAAGTRTAATSALPSALVPAGSSLYMPAAPATMLPEAEGAPGAAAAKPGIPMPLAIGAGAIGLLALFFMLKK